MVETAITGFESGETSIDSEQKQKRDVCMTDVTVNELAKVIGIESNKLLQQMKDAGLTHSNPDDNVSDEEKQKLLAFLKKSHGSSDDQGEKKVTLKRKSVSTLKLSGSDGKKKTINVEVRKKRTYVSPSKAAEEAAVAEQAAAEQAAQEEIARKEAQATAAALEAKKQADQAAQEKLAKEQAQAQQAQAEDASKSQAKPVQNTVSKDTKFTPNRDTASRKAALGAGISSKTKDVKYSSDQQQAHAKSEPQIKPEDQKARKEADEKAKQKTLEEARKVAAELARREASGQKTPKATDDDLGVKDEIVKQALEESFAEEERRVKRSKVKERTGSKSEREKERKITQLGHRARKVRLKGTGEHGFQNPTSPMTREVKINGDIVVADLANQMSLKGSVVVKELFKIGIMANINQTIDQETAVLVVEELGHQPVMVSDNALEEDLEALVAKQPEEQFAATRPPVVTIMGHVDHGKTSLLDHIRTTKIAAGEAGGITQHIGAYHVETERGVVTFLDTPGHAAFTAMRARGAQATDIVILVVAGDDGVKPQTIEAIQHAKAAEVPLIVAINKMDKEGIDLERVRSELSTQGVISEEWGGDIQFVPVSAHTGLGIDTLLEAILLQSELLELKGLSDGPSKGVVIESRLDKGRGVITSFLVQEGRLKVGDTLLAGEHIGRVRAMYDELGRSIDSAGPSMPVEVLGLSSVPEAGESFMAVPDEKKAREVAELRKVRAREKRFSRQHASKLENIFDHLKTADTATVNLVIKADVRGSMEAIIGSLEDLSTSEVQVSVVSSGVGGINETDANLAITSNATLIGFNTRADASAKAICQAEGIDIRYYSVIYDIIDDVKKAMSGLLEPERREEILGVAEVRDVFRSSKFGTAAGCMVVEGTLYRNKPIRVLRDDVVVFKGELESLRRFKDDAPEVRNGFECGIAVKSYNDVKVGDKIEVFDIKIIDRTL